MSTEYHEEEHRIENNGRPYPPSRSAEQNLHFLERNRSHVAENRREAAVAPVPSRVLQSCLSPLFRTFDWVFGSRWNPVYGSGTIAVALLCGALVSGIYLICFYSLTQPYESVAAIQSHVWVGRWVRAFHRYTADAAVVAVLFHVVQLLIHGRTSGPRVLAWLTGVLLALGLFVAGWTGYVLVWDQHGQRVALAGGKLLELVPFLSDLVVPAFNGTTAISSSFFFMNLFLHVVIPLAMIFGVWIHTARLNHPDWLPPKPVVLVLAGSFLGLSLAWPVPLQPKADLSTIPGEMPIDFVYGFWIPVSEWLSPALTLTGAVAGTMFAFSIPLWWNAKQRKGRTGVSQVQADGCIGCNQCSLDCPFGAISMVSREARSPRLAVVDAAACVSCGVCAAACPTYVIGPPGRTAGDSIAELQQYVRPVDNSTQSVFLFVCSRNQHALDEARRLASGASIPVEVYPIECCGTIHADGVKNLLETYGVVVVWTCPEQNCRNRKGALLAHERLERRRQPMLPRDVNPERIRVISASLREFRPFFEQILSREEGSVPIRLSSSVSVSIRRIIGIITLLLAIATLTRIPVGKRSEGGIVRVAARLSGASREECRTATAEELERLPVHMRRPEICERTLQDYRVRVAIDGAEILSKDYTHGGMRGDRPVFVSEDIVLDAGKYRLDIELVSLRSGAETGHRLVFHDSVTIEPGKITAVRYDPVSDSLVSTEESFDPEPLEGKHGRPHALSLFPPSERAING